jgi:hypothetical protein
LRDRHRVPRRRHGRRRLIAAAAGQAGLRGRSATRIRAAPTSTTRGPGGRRGPDRVARSEFELDPPVEQGGRVVAAGAEHRLLRPDAPRAGPALAAALLRPVGCGSSRPAPAKSGRLTRRPVGLVCPVRRRQAASGTCGARSSAATRAKRRSPPGRARTASSPGGTPASPPSCRAVGRSRRRAKACSASTRRPSARRVRYRPL